MRKYFYSLQFFISLISLMIVMTVSAGLSGLYVLADDKEGGKSGKLKVGYCQDGDYFEFDYELYYIGKALVGREELVSEGYSALSESSSAEDTWEVLSDGNSPEYEFVREGFFDISREGFSSLSPEAIVESLSEKIEEYDIDIMITMGTSAGLAVQSCKNVPYMNFIASDPVRSELTGGIEFSGNDLEWAHVNIGVEEKALSVMYDIFSPASLGIVYNDTPDAYIYSGGASVDAFADEKGLSVLKEYVSDDFEDTQEEYLHYKNSLLSAHQKLADSGIDLYILTTSYLKPGDFYESLQPFIEKGIPVFSINSTEDVRFGALAAVEMIDYENIGLFAADNLESYRRGTPLSKIPQLYVTAPFLVLNIDTCRESGIKMTLDTLISASKIYKKYNSD